jgi:hypothetical protein
MPWRSLIRSRRKSGESERGTAFVNPTGRAREARYGRNEQLTAGPDDSSFRWSSGTSRARAGRRERGVPGARAACALRPRAVQSLSSVLDSRSKLLEHTLACRLDQLNTLFSGVESGGRQSSIFVSGP